MYNVDPMAHGIACPACNEVRRQLSSGVVVSVCGIIRREHQAGQSNFMNFEIVPQHCQNYTICSVWRQEKEVEWKKKMGTKYSSLAQAEQIRVRS